MCDCLKTMSSLVVATLLAVLLATNLSLAHDEDFGFEVSGDFEVEFDGAGRKLWTNKEIIANVGRAFHLVVPKEAFGLVDTAQTFEAKRVGNKPLPIWLLFDKTGGVFWGVPLTEDIETVNIIVKSLNSDKNITEQFTINVIEPINEPQFLEKCPTNEDKTILTLLVDRGIRTIKPKQRIIAINNIAKFFGLPFSAFTLKPQKDKDDITDSSVVLAGPGNLKARTSKLTSLLQVPVGCDGRLWVQTAPLVHQLKQQARDGTISEVIGLPLIGWRVKTETGPVLREKRQIDDNGSGDYDDYYDENYDDEYENENEPSSKSSSTTTAATSTSEIHPHRHHHGEIKGDEEAVVPVFRENTLLQVERTTPVVVPESTSTTTTSTTTTTTEKATTSTTTTTTEAPTTKSTTTVQATTEEKTNPAYDYEYEDYDDEDGDDNENPTIVPDTSQEKTETTVKIETTMITTPKTTTEEIVITSPSSTTTFTTITTTSTTTTTEDPTTVIIEDTEPTTMTTETTTAIPIVAVTTTTTTTTTPTTTTIPTTTETITTELDDTTIKQTTLRHVISSTPRTTTTREITDPIEYEPKNFPPYIENRLQQMSVIAGKIFRFVIPKNTFKDFEDGHNLTLEFLNARGEPIANDSWCHFNPIRREIYGLPLEEDVSKWEYMIRASDRDGATVTDRFTIQVQQHKSQRVVNHEFSLLIRIEKQQEFPHYVDWCLKILRSLGRIYNTNMSEITVRHVNYTSEPVVFTWTNDSVPTKFCPDAAIDSLFKVLTANDHGDPSRELNLALAPELRVKKVLYHGLGVCERPQIPVTPPTNFRPFLRNPVDHINATVGELLVFKVPDDTFYDPEDTDSRILNITLLTADRQPIPPTNWLQFDSKNREFYGIPKKAGRSEYQLVCVDSAGLPATDSLEIVVYPAPKINYNVEFSMTVESSYEAFANSASMQKKFVEKLQQLFDDRNASFIHLNPLKPKHDSTIVTWYNKSLPTSHCAHDDINRLETQMKSPDHGISNAVHSIMEPEFPVSTIKVLPIANCKLKSASPPLPPTDDRSPVDDSSAAAEATSDDYLITFIVPAVIISVMLLLASVAACVLYRRRRTGKMNVEEDGRQSYGNKGIPVIFQEELEEKPEAGTKAPVILKDEKPPLAPPEYSKSGSLKTDDAELPYQPPPPFTRTQDNGRQARPKPTPTYRKPPPYVPP